MVPPASTTRPDPAKQKRVSRSIVSGLAAAMPGSAVRAGGAGQELATAARRRFDLPAATRRTSRRRQRGSRPFVAGLLLL